MQPIRYVVGLVFDQRFPTNLALIQKNRPEFLNGKLNGPGGQIETNEDSEAAVSREIKEEIGLDIPTGAWKLVCTLIGRATATDAGYEILFYKAKADLNLAESKTDEPLKIIDTDMHQHHSHLVRDLNWIIPLAQDDDISPHVVVYRKQ